MSIYMCAVTGSLQVARLPQHDYGGAAPTGGSA
jgi:hypothetical protein